MNSIDTSDAQDRTYIVAGVGQWNKQAFNENVKSLAGIWIYAQSVQELEAALDRFPNPDYAFFPHWRWIVPEELTTSVECVCFHMTDLPYGRGGSPLQNLIVDGKEETFVTALRMVKELDAGPIYFKEPMTLDGPAHQIYQRATRKVWKLIKRIVCERPKPTPQVGEVKCFRRRTPTESELPSDASLNYIYDHIRMLDAPGYPHAYIDHGNLRIEFVEAKLRDDSISASVEITRIKS